LRINIQFVQANVEDADALQAELELEGLSEGMRGPPSLRFLLA
jgi:hypothetical protein